MVGILIVLVAVLIVKIEPKNSDTNKNQPQSQEKSQENTTTVTPFVYNSPTPKTPKIYKYGEKAMLNSGRYITVFNPIIDYKPEEAPGGKKYVLVEAEYGNAGSKKTACYVSLRLGDSKDTFYDNSYGVTKSPGLDCRNLEDQAYIQPGKSIRGFTTFEVNTDTVLKKIIYQDYEHEDKITFSD